MASSDGELGTVDKTTTCCFQGFAAASLMPGPEGTAQCTGCGCDRDYVDEIVAKLKKRQEMRGDRAKVRLAETTLDSLQELHKKVDIIMAHMDLPVQQATMDR